jgi:Mrp family chromosome partitioning ATPase
MIYIRYQILERTYMIIACGGIKGGVGKTTIATNLAIIRAASGADVALDALVQGKFDGEVCFIHASVSAD